MNPTAATTIGTTSLTVSRLGLGAAPLAGLYQGVPERDAWAVVERAYAAGVTLYDTAPLYGSGLSEQRLGHVLLQKPRDSFVVSTKVGYSLTPGAPGGETIFPEAPPLVAEHDFSYDATLRSLAGSLERLGLDRVDIVYIHDPDEHFEAALTGAYRALDRLRAEGVIRAVGVGMNQSALLTRFAHAADVDCFLLAGRYTLLDQTALYDLLPVAAEGRISIVIGGVYNSGILANPAPGSTYNYAPADRALVEKAQRLQEVCARFAVPLKAAAIQFPFGHPAISSVLAGCRSVAEMDENLELIKLPIPAALWEDLKREGLLPADVPVPGQGA